MACDTVDDGDIERVLKDISVGGLCFKSTVPLSKGSRIRVRIPIEDPPFEAEAVVAWCRKEDDYCIGVKFVDESTEFSLRMVEQACYIKHYLYEAEKAGRQLTSDEAAHEWIIKYAAVFPR